MPSIDIRVHNLGMSGRPWAKHGTFEKAPEAAAFLHYWWANLSCPTDWELSIDGQTYETIPPFPKKVSERHILYCYDFHRAFYSPASGED